MGGALAKLFSYPDKILAAFFLKVLPEFLRLIVLSICIIWKYYKLIKTNYKYISAINKKTFKFPYKKRERPELAECSICLSEFAEGEEGREIIDCKHVFHRHCLEKWLQGFTATCPLCRSLVVPEVMVAEYKRMQIEQENNRIEKELALILLNALHGGSCNGFF
ncbi:hypothetical protein CDL12_23646 [Handroanthus impetiginosus]|uniref:RING-type domain-containing protein n=1 Tax=Handroanthus impetiginosus TaxID=429701 RepID=A0A2G9GEW8_9LAMI|nr:hypothetical protein CDL12_23646 [Handroanthus impetiginosus]